MMLAVFAVAECGGTLGRDSEATKEDQMDKPREQFVPGTAREETDSEPVTTEKSEPVTPSLEVEDCETGSWTVETVDSESAGWHAALALDGHDRPHLTYEDGVDLHYAHKTEIGEWESETEDLGGVGAYTALAVGDDGRVHVGAQVGNVGYAARRGAGEWEWKELIPSSFVEYTGFASSIAVDARGTHMSFYLFDVETGDAFAVYARLEEDEPELILLGEAGFAADYSTVAVATDGAVHLVWSGYDPGNATVYYGTRPVGEDWQVEIIQHEARYDKFQPALALDETGQPHLAYAGEWQPTLYHAHREAGGWIREMVSEDGKGRPAIAAGAANETHLTFFDAELGRVRYARRESGLWAFEDIVSEPTGVPSSIALDETGKVHASFSQDGVRYATRCP